VAGAAVDIGGMLLLAAASEGTKGATKGAAASAQAAKTVRRDSDRSLKCTCDGAFLHLYLIQLHAWLCAWRVLPLPAMLRACRALPLFRHRLHPSASHRSPLPAATGCAPCPLISSRRTRAAHWARSLRPVIRSRSPAAPAAP